MVIKSKQISIANLEMVDLSWLFFKASKNAEKYLQLLVKSFCVYKANRWWRCKLDKRYIAVGAAASYESDNQVEYVSP